MNKFVVRLIPVLFLFALAVNPPYAQARPTAVQEKQTDCTPGTGWRWVDGPEQPQAAQQAAEALSKAGITATVKAYGYGEVDSCRNYFPHGVDLSITLQENQLLQQSSQGDVEANVKKSLRNLHGVTLGNIRVTLPEGKTLALRPDTPQLIQPELTTQAAGVKWQLANPAQKPSGRMASGLVYDSYRGKVVAFGGDNTGYSRLNDTWEYDGVNWTLKTTAHSPEGRVNVDQGMAFDSWRNRVVLFGGLGTSQYYNDTWEYNGSDWTNISTTNQPSPRDAQALAFDSQRGKTVLFGGYTYNGRANDTWEYNGTWHEVSLPVKPSARYHASMAYDQNRKVVVLFGGSDSTGVLNDTWEYNGTQWTHKTPTQSPPARDNHSITYDSNRHVIVLFGGSTNGASLGDTWEYDGTTWTQMTTTQAPPARNEHSLVYDSARDKVVLFGGGTWDTGFSPSNETWEYPYNASTGGYTFDKKVLVVAYNPWVDSGHTTRLWDYYHWNSYTEITNQVINFFKTNSGNQVQYRVVETKIIDEIPRMTDGYQYTVQEYIDIMNHVKQPHNPDGVDYNFIVNDPRLDICGKANRGEIDEVWAFNGPYYGFWESTLVGPDSYFYNSGPVPGPFTCTRMIPIMGPNPERWISEFVEDFGHRTESTMGRVYNYEWDQNQTRSSYEKFALVASKSPDYGYSGCGNVHYPPNGQTDYDWGNPASAQTYCDDFVNYPNLHDPTTVLKTVTCSTWNCDSLTYFGWWYSHYPKNTGCGPDSVANNWWVYFAYPELALNPIKGCSIYDLPYRLYIPAVRK